MGVRQSQVNERLEAVVLMLLGILLLYYRASGKLALLIHPNYVALVTVAGSVLASMGAFLALERWRRPPRPVPAEEHATLFAPRLSLALLILTIAIGFGIPPQPLSSLTAVNRGAAEGLLSQQGTLNPQPFRISFNSQDRSLTDWVRTLNAYPDPEAYAGLPAQVQGFVIHPGNFADPELFLAAQFEIVCCAADARPTGLPVRWPQAQTLIADRWYEIGGTMAVEEVRGQSHLIIAADRVTEIPTPASPYAY